jgi:TolB protein
MWLSPDEKQLAVNQLDTQTGSSYVWLLDLVKGIPSRFTTDYANDSNPIWSADGTKIVFTSTRDGIGSLYQRIRMGRK